MRSARPVQRATALLMTATIGALGPGLLPLPAAAQPTVAPEDGGFYASPPPVDMGYLPGDTGQPDQNYTQKVGCVERDLENNIQLNQAPWGQLYLRLDEVHRLMRGTTKGVGIKPNGQPVRVAVIDTGVTASHPFFEGRVKSGGDYVKDTGQPGLEDCDGHGTEVAGIIAADTPEDQMKFTGVAPDAEIISIRQSSQNYAPDDSATPSQGAGGDAGGQSGGDAGDAGGDAGDAGGAGGASGPGRPGGTGAAQDGGGRTQGDEGSAGTLDTLAQAVVRATAMGVDVINVSINNCRSADGGITEGEKRLQAAVHNAVENNVVVVAAAGNLSEKCEQNDQPDANAPKTIVTPPWFAEDVLSVAAIDKTGGVADFSLNGPWVSVAAPGTEIISLDPAEGSSGLANLTIENGESQPIKGTSFAAPYVAGLAALVRAKFPELNAREVMNRITSTAQHPAAPGGRDNFVGYGVIDPMAALTATVPEEEGLPPDSAVALPSDMPPAADRNWTPVIVALAGSGGALTALLVTLFVVHTIRRNRPAEPR
ncbi:membrane-anchored mycosin MYCP [Prauserella muralis]|nr:membrane-anchored mycosin MYCP [Prauserella muralis]